jgi:hypothetical protein
MVHLRHSSPQADSPLMGLKQSCGITVKLPPGSPWNTAPSGGLSTPRRPKMEPTPIRKPALNVPTAVADRSAASRRLSPPPLSRTRKEF